MPRSCASLPSTRPFLIRHRSRIITCRKLKMWSRRLEKWQGIDFVLCSWFLVLCSLYLVVERFLVQFSERTCPPDAREILSSKDENETTKNKDQRTKNKARFSGEFMSTEVVMPQMGESIAEGTITRWLKKVGDRVERDEPLFEISTDKVDAEIPSPAAGVLTEVLF